MERSEILTEDWLVQCWKERDHRTFDAFETNFIRTYRAKPLHNLNLFFFGASDEIEQRHLHTLTSDNGQRREKNLCCFLNKNENLSFLFQAVLSPMKSAMQHTLSSVMEWM